MAPFARSSRSTRETGRAGLQGIEWQGWKEGDNPRRLPRRERESLVLVFAPFECQVAVKQQDLVGNTESERLTHARTQRERRRHFLTLDSVSDQNEGLVSLSLSVASLVPVPRSAERKSSFFPASCACRRRRRQPSRCLCLRLSLSRSASRCVAFCDKGTEERRERGREKGGPSSRASRHLISERISILLSLFSLLLSRQHPSPTPLLLLPSSLPLSQRDVTQAALTSASLCLSLSFGRRCV